VEHRRKVTVDASAAAATSAPSYFRALELDAVPELLHASYELRYQVYCLERQFLPTEPYPLGFETDVFDQHAVHLGVLNSEDALVATARLVPRTEDGLPMYGHCSLLVHDPVLADFTAPIVEVSRLAVSRRYNRRKGDEHYGLEGGTRDTGEKRREGGEIVMTLYRALYQASKRHGFSHWLAATERSLQRLVVRYHFPFKQVGPETDYFGMVAPYLMDLAEFDREILSGEVPALRHFLDGLEPHLLPGPLHAS
jgi:N-acyl amino acid synthase of PEP-CTERM/exosortase system